MEPRERVREETVQQGPPPAPAGGNPGGGLDELRNAARDFLAAGDDAINKALSKGNSEAFLTANRQEGGE